MNRRSLLLTGALLAALSPQAKAVKLPKDMQALQKQVEKAATPDQALATLKAFAAKARAYPQLWKTQSKEPRRIGIAGKPTELGMRIEMVADMSAAQEAGIETGEILVSVDGQPVHDVPEVAAMVQALKPGASMTLRLTRGGDEREVRVVPRQNGMFAPALPLPRLMPSLGKGGHQFLMFSDVLCPHCGPAWNVAHKAMQTKTFKKSHTRFYYIPFDLGFDDTGFIVKATACMMDKPDRYYAFLDKAFRARNTLRGSSVKPQMESFMKEVGNAKGAETCWDNPRAQSWLNIFRVLGQLKGVAGTPFFYINGKKANLLALPGVD